MLVSQPQHSQAIGSRERGGVAWCGMWGQGEHTEGKKSRLTYLTLMKTELLFVVVACATDFPSTGVDEVGVQWVQAAVFIETLRQPG